MSNKKERIARPSRAKKAKRLEEYRQEKPDQLNFFELMLPEEKQYSNTIELYDFIPKYHWGKVQRINGEFLRPLEREFECRGSRYRVQIAPAKIKDQDGVFRDYYPSKREELVEDALRKLASDGQGVFLDDEAGVTFTLYQLQQELQRSGHTYSKDQIKDALMICARTNITVTTEDGKAVIMSNLFETLGLQTREDWVGAGQKTRAFVRFNSLVTQSIRRGTFRRLNYEKSMAYKSVIARQLHKRMAHHYTQASITHPYHLLLTTIIRDFGLTAYRWLSQNLRDVQTALAEMKEKEVVLSYQIEKTLDSGSRNALVEAKFVLVPHPRFINEVMHSNRRQVEILKLPPEV